MKVIKDNEILFDEILHSSANKFSLTNGYKGVAYILVQQIDETEFLAKIKIVCVHNALAQSFDILFEQILEYEGEDYLDIAVQLYNNLNEKLRNQDTYKWIKAGLKNDPPKDIVSNVTRFIELAK